MQHGDNVVPGARLVRVVRKQDEAVGICSFELQSTDGQPLPEYDAGSHIDIFLPGKIVRQYSLCKPYDAGARYLIGVKREQASKGGSRYMHDSVHEGDQLWVGVPRNLFPLAQHGRSHILFAGGIGITPLICMASFLARQGAEFELHYFAQSADHVAFRKVLEHPGMSGSVRLHHAVQPEDLPAFLGDVLQPVNRDAHLYMCGPQKFMEAIRAAAFEFPNDRVHWESFGTRRDERSAEVNNSVQEFVVEAVKSNKQVTVAAGETIIHALRRIDVEVETSCERGYCGTCFTRVLGGDPDHRDEFLTDEERNSKGCIMPCVSRSLSTTLTLDV